MLLWLQVCVEVCCSVFKLCRQAAAIVCTPSSNCADRNMKSVNLWNSLPPKPSRSMLLSLQFCGQVCCSVLKLCRHAPAIVCPLSSNCADRNMKFVNLCTPGYSSRTLTTRMDSHGLLCGLLLMFFLCATLSVLKESGKRGVLGFFEN